METRTAPGWIRKTEKRYRRARWMWRCVTLLGWLGWIGSMLCWQMPNALWWNVLRVACPAAFAAFLFLAPGQRAKRCGVGARIVEIAIVRFEASPDRPESELTEASQRARETLRVKKIRTAPAWVLAKRKGYRMKILGWIGPALFALALPAFAVLLQWGWVQRWHAAVFLAVFVLYAIGALFGTRKLMRARDTLSQAIERYEYESAATESGLEEAAGRAAEVAA